MHDLIYFIRKITVYWLIYQKLCQLRIALAVAVDINTHTSVG